MNTIQVENEMKCLERHPRFFEHINVAVVTDGFGQTVGIYNTVQLAKDWQRMGEDYFQRVYGFHWMPSEALLKLCRHRKKR